MNFVPLNKHILVKPTEAKDRTASGLYLAAEAVKASPRGVVVAVADEVPVLAVGDTVVYGKWSELLHDGETYRIVAFEDVLGKVGA